MKLWKAILISVTIIIATFYLVWTVFHVNRQPNNKLCQKVNISISGDVEGQYVTQTDVLYLLNRHNLNPVGKTNEQIKLSALEKQVLQLAAVKTVKCYQSNNGDINITITPRKPFYKVMTESGNFYIDTERQVMPTSTSFTAYVPIVTGSITKSFAQNEMFDFVVYLQDDKFLSAQVEQIHLLPNGTVELIPRVGSHRIQLGRLINYEQKLSKLKIFYTKALNKVGWNRYSMIDLRYQGQVVCTKY